MALMWVWVQLTLSDLVKEMEEKSQSQKQKLCFFFSLEMNSSDICSSTDLLFADSHYSPADVQFLSDSLKPSQVSKDLLHQHG